MVLIQLNLHQSFFKISLAIYISTLLSYSLIVLTTAVLYLLACDPLPPCTGWLSEWLRSLRSTRVATQANPRPNTTASCLSTVQRYAEDWHRGPGSLRGVTIRRG